jgi:oligoribonuclease NrnB/cAMP/cGMP phosphodiesterase (DHH superfamily)
MQTICLHHNDADGRASAAIVRRALGKGVAFFEMNYGEPVPWEAARQAKRIIVVDFSLQKEEMLRMAELGELIWIDHHISAINEFSQISKHWSGLRDTREAACVLTWKYFFPDQPVPRGIVLISDRDAWHWVEEETGPFDEGLYQKDTDPSNDELWEPLLEDDPQAVADLVSRGSILREARLNNIRRKVDQYGFPVVFEGHRVLAINTRGNGDIGAYVRDLGYDMAYCYVDNCQNNTLMTFVGLYSSKVDVSKIATKFGGGGHRGASGFSFERDCEPFPPGANVGQAVSLSGC